MEVPQNVSMQLYNEQIIKFVPSYVKKRRWRWVLHDLISLKLKPTICVRVHDITITISIIKLSFLYKIDFPLLTTFTMYISDNITNCPLWLVSSDTTAYALTNLARK